MIERLNYHHLYYFWSVARIGRLTEAARRLNVSPSALSTQIRQLEESAGQALFQRRGRRLELTEAGRIALAYADDIFRRGEELTAVLSAGARPGREIVRIGAVATLSRNFQEAFIAPLLDRPEVQFVLQSGRMEDLLRRLETHALDLVLSNVAVRGDHDHPWRSRRIARQRVSVVGKPRSGRRFRLPQDLHDVELVLPASGSDIRTSFDMLCEQWGLRPHIRAEVDDMALLRLLARDTDALAVLPRVVVRDEIFAGVLCEHTVLPDVYEAFYAISVRRHFASPVLQSLLDRAPGEVLEAAS